MARRALVAVAMSLCAGCAAPENSWYGELSGSIRLPDGQQQLNLVVENPNATETSVSVFWSLRATDAPAATLLLSRDVFAAEADGQGALDLAGLDSLSCGGERACVFRYTLSAEGDNYAQLAWTGSARIDWSALAADDAPLAPSFSLSVGEPPP